MKHAIRIVLTVILLAALPLRGYADVLMAACAEHHGAAAAQEHAHKSGDSHHHESFDDGDGSAAHAASVCSVCASCCAGAGLPPETGRGMALQMHDVLRIPFFDRHVSGFVSENLYRPPLVL